MKWLLSILLIFVPYVSSWEQEREPSDSTRILNDIKILNTEKEIIIDSFKTLRQDIVKKDTIIKSYNSDAIDGTRETWNFVYKVKYNKWTKDFDTLFLCVKKEKSKW